MAKRIRDHNWAATPLGPLDGWSSELRSYAAFVLENHFPAALVWGPGLVTIFNDAFEPILGDKPEALGRSFSDIWSEAWHEIGPIAERALSGLSTFIDDHPLVINRSGVLEQAYFTFSYSPVRAGDGIVCGFIDTVVETTARVKVEEHNRLLASIVEFGGDAIITTDIDGIIASWNDGARRLYGYCTQESIGKPITLLIPLDRHDEEHNILERIRRGERIEHYETVRQRKDGTQIDISLRVSPIKDRAGKIVGASKIARDITERKRSKYLVATLAREAEHRTKNVLATVSATIQLSDADAPDKLKSIIQGRIQALSAIHALFVKSRWTGADVATIVEQELNPYIQEREQRAHLVGPQISVNTAAAQSLAVAVHELATNAAKYGALSNVEGSLRVEWSKTVDGQVRLNWQELDGPSVEVPTRKGFGTNVIQKMIMSQGGTIEFEWNPRGLCCEISLPA